MKAVTYVVMDDYDSMDPEAIQGPAENRKALFKQALKVARKMQRKLRDFDEPGDVSIYRLVKELPDEDF